MSSKSATAPESLLDELQATLAHGTVARRVETLRRVTDLFVNGANRLNEDQVALFDDVIGLLIDQIEIKALVELGELRRGLEKEKSESAGVRVPAGRQAA